MEDIIKKLIKAEKEDSLLYEKIDELYQFFNQRQTSISELILDLLGFPQDNTTDKHGNLTDYQSPSYFCRDAYTEMILEGSSNPNKLLKKLKKEKKLLDKYFTFKNE